ncbi:Mitochondrial ribosomal protein L17 [Phaffia rhodozyma]|uniref:Large ribosomal subunit protein mL46 n=1 Tax=Phaffia rhodozyma TaxID=264483 RepID=A0A0F7SV87_PHARH|nr:Mitochondrial ribosomal protein L17 [Phaffia rhodozyma]
MASHIRHNGVRHMSSATKTVSAPNPLVTQVLLHRRPFLTPPKPAHMDAVYDYNFKLRKALSSLFPTHLYLKKGSMAMKRYTYEQAMAEHEAFGTPIPEDIEVVEKDVAAQAIQPRDTLEKAAESRGEKSLDRKGERSLYLVVKGKQGWRFPGGVVESKQAGEGQEQPSRLDQIARKTLHAHLGPDMSVWPVGRFPIAYIPSDSSVSSSKTFVFKTHILAGQPAISDVGSKAGIQDFAWLTKEEIGERALSEGSEEGKLWWNTVGDLLNEY